jgi:cytochrome c biogenesis protein CcmG, thiol:disulfide interchange protein DsbE
VTGHRVGLAVLLSVAIAILVLLALAVRQPTAGPRIAGLAPDFALTTFSGDAVRLQDLRGKVVVLNFWASWCRTCAQEAADLEAIWQDYRDRGVIVIGIDYVDTQPAALAYLSDHGITYPNGPDLAGRISRSYRLTGVPETVVIDGAGRVASLPLAGAKGLAVERITGPIVATAPFTPADLRGVLDRLTTAVAGGS